MLASSSPRPPAPRPWNRWAPWLALAADAVLVVVFVAVGQRQHLSGGGIGPLLQTAAPFLVALVVASLATAVWHTWHRIWPHGVLVVAGTVALGMTLRVWWGLGGAPTSFVLVATATLSAFLLARRTLSSLTIRKAH
ncbi:DUF3054 domain-containing protein [Micrococcus sp.]|uniref:DUF3054 domain-containing protein n=1 Tax=Micrococcus sp. TaxID=1271 RepID=UPI002A91E9C9|nr:DUF3054 domain-containing protein [Micrococcus sp.]MDY6055415.1 DUF3054 domain-containing protein [Micrococcus sp.]